METRKVLKRNKGSQKNHFVKNEKWPFVDGERKTLSIMHLVLLMKFQWTKIYLKTLNASMPQFITLNAN